MTWYLAYGSNLHPIRLIRRVSSARLIGAVELPGYKLAFIKRSKDGSAKCTISSSADGGCVHAAIYSIDPKQISELDTYEGRGFGYEHHYITVELEGSAYNVFTYIATATHIDSALKPYNWYKELVLEGARYNGFPAEYIETLQSTASIQDPDVNRCRKNEALLTEFAMWKRRSS